jgi:Transposase
VPFTAAATSDHAAAQLYAWTVDCIDSGVAEIARLARTITTWREKFLAYFSAARLSNGPNRSRQPFDEENQPITGSETSTTIGYAYYCTAASPGNITPQHHSEAAYPAWLRRAG